MDALDVDVEQSLWIAFDAGGLAQHRREAAFVGELRIPEASDEFRIARHRRQFFQ